MSCCQIDGIEEYMDSGMARRELDGYRKKGPDRTTRMLLEAITAQGVEGLGLLDIGGGVGALQHELLAAGVDRVVSVDASSAYLEAAESEAARRGHADRIDQRHGDFVRMAERLERMEIVTLDRVICCYDNMEDLVAQSARLASRLYGVVYPRDGWWVKAITAVENLYHRLRGSQFRVFAHANQAVDRIIQESGLEPLLGQKTAFWRVDLYVRTGF